MEAKTQLGGEIRRIMKIAVRATWPSFASNSSLTLALKRLMGEKQIPDPALRF